MWWVSDSAEKIYIHHSRAKKVSYFSKGRGSRTTAKRNNMQSTTTACHSSNANASGSEKCGFMSGMKDNAAGFCDLTKKQIRDTVSSFVAENQDPESKMWEVSMKLLTVTFFLLLFNSMHGQHLLLCTALCCLSSGIETSFVLENTRCNLFSFVSLAAHLSLPTGTA